MRIVLVRLSALGDVVHTWPLASALATARPPVHLTWVVEEPLRILVEGHPAVDSVVEDDVIDLYALGAVDYDPALHN